ncbi:MAG: L-lactate permease [Defluviitaleaceae bacterium]|nr:L-lactate permease [Defluviitaleaceae bacterium]
MFAIISVLPIAIVIVSMSIFKQKSSMSLFLGWGLAVIFAIFIWNMNITHAITWTVFGFLSAIPVLLVIFGAIFMLNTLLELRFIEKIGNGFRSISNDRRIQILFVAWFFGALLEGAAGFGTPGAIAAPLLVAIGIPTLFAAMALLMANASSTTFGAAGTPTTGGWNSIQDNMVSQYGAETAGEIFFQLNTRAAFATMIVSIILPFLIIASITSKDGRKRGLKDALPILPLCLFSGIIFLIPFWLTSFLSHNIPTLAATIISMPIFLIAVKKGFLVPKEIYRFKDDEIKEITKNENTGVSGLTAWMPYVVVVAFLILTRLPWSPIATWLNPANQMIRIHNIFGQGVNFNFNPFWNPGVMPFIPVTIFVMFFRKTKLETAKKITKKTLLQLKHASIALLFGIALVQIMLNTNFSNISGALGSMTSEIALALTEMFGNTFLAVSPFIGILGSFISGSTTVSNIMFMGLQVEAAQAIGLPIVLILVSQTMGAAAGNMLSINNIIAISATTGYKGKESTIMSSTVVTMLIYTILSIIVFYTLLALGVGWVA